METSPGQEKFPSKISLWTHLENVHPGKSRPCSICNKEFKALGTYRKHLSNSHGWSRYKCQICSDVSRFPTEIAEHMLSKHPGIECAQCQSCDQMVNFGGNPLAFEDHVR